MDQLAGTALRGPIAQSWRRATLAGLDPATVLAGLQHADTDPRSHLVTAAGPVLDALNDRLRGTGMYTLLVDHTGRVVYCRGDHEIMTNFDALGIGPGTLLSEESVGTNGPGTALEVRSKIVVNGVEHFAESLRSFSCCGQPILHPTTHRLQGALDITLKAAEVNPLLPALVAMTVAEIEQRLLDASRASERALLAAFQSVARRKGPVVAIGDNLLLANDAATDLLDAADVAMLRSVVDEAGRLERELDLGPRPGQRSRVRVERVAGARGGVLVHIARIETVTGGKTRNDRGSRPVAARPDVTAGHVHISGPPGSGRSTEAQKHLLQPHTVLKGGEAHLDGSAAWARRWRAAIQADSSICIDDADLLPAPLIELVTDHAASGREPHLVVVTDQNQTLSGPMRALAARCDTTIELLPLAHRQAELPEITAGILGGIDAGKTHYLSLEVMRVLSAYDWPGNLTELRAALELATRRCLFGEIRPEDLPPIVVAGAAGRDLAPIERAERHAIVAALRTTRGNKTLAARSLGISRTTLYTRIRALKIPVAKP